MRESLCKGCGAEILWLKTVRGKNMPVDPIGEARIIRNQHDEAVMVQTYMPHWATCPKADEFKKEK